ncbi:hypothetical protein [Palleronia sp. LCG004]|uniref:hypothetical protein n=1 Tax=Palleronia sp. LCG004 TaxID=3079304 RepID=UPI0029422A3B|nr:hypothetical protein [Palleronia sp. LCG004]WOI54943.1 hypothetical protein RVY76_07650 [Palleronia sp. LCG004]
MMNVDDIPRVEIPDRDRAAPLRYYDGEPLTFIVDNPRGWLLVLTLASTKAGGIDPEATREKQSDPRMKAMLGLAGSEEIFDVPNDEIMFVREGDTFYGNLLGYDPDHLDRPPRMLRAIEIKVEPSIRATLIPEIVLPFAIGDLSDVTVVQEAGGRTRLPISASGGITPYSLAATFGTIEGQGADHELVLPHDTVEARTVTVSGRDVTGAVDEAEFTLLVVARLAVSPVEEVRATVRAGGTAIVTPRILGGLNPKIAATDFGEIVDGRVVLPLDDEIERIVTLTVGDDLDQVVTVEFAFVASVQIPAAWEYSVAGNMLTIASAPAVVAPSFGVDGNTLTITG